MSNKVKILNHKQIGQKLNRLAYEVYEKNFDEKELFVIGIEGNGYMLAKALVAKLKAISPLTLKLGKISLNKETPWKEKPGMDFSEKEVLNKNLLMVDDVLNSGKTLMYAVKVLLDKPVKKLNTLVLVDRSHSRFPVKADFVGLSLSTSLQEHIAVDLARKNQEAVYLS